MRARLSALALAPILALTACTSSKDDAPEPAALPAPLPSVELEPFEGGEPVDLADQRGPMLVNFWASYCGPCRDEMPLLQEYAEQQDDVALLGINFLDPRRGKAEELVRDTGVTYPLLSDPDGELDRNGPFPHLRGLPFMAFVDADGEVVAWEFGEVHDMAELEALVDEHLGAA